MVPATRIALGVLGAAAAVALLALWLASGELFEDDVLQGLAGPKPLYAPSPPVSASPRKAAPP